MFINLGSTTFFGQLPKQKEAVFRHTPLFVIQWIEIMQVSTALNGETSCRVVLGACPCAVSREHSHAEEEDVLFTGELNWSAGLVHLLDDCNEELAS